MGFELCYLPGTPAVLRALAGPTTRSGSGGSSFTVLTSSSEVAQQYVPTLTNLASDNQPSQHRWRGDLRRL
jgi:hypothetical protein